MAFGKLFTVAGNSRTTGILAVAKANNIDLEVVEAQIGNATAEHLDVHGLGKIPALITEDGYKLFESTAIAIYIASQNEKTTLLGKTKQDYASILKWMSFFNTEIATQLARWTRPLLGAEPYNKKNVEDAQAATLKAISVVEAYLVNNTFLVGERVSLADLYAAGLISGGFEYFFDVKFRQEYPATTRWFSTIIAQPIYSAVATPLEFLETPKLTNTAPKKADAPKKEKKAEAPKPAASAAEEPAEAPKAKHPIELLPRASYPIDEWKRFYSNNETPDAMKYFWETIPFEEYSIWKVQYKYNDELTLTFMSNNLIGGFNNRLEGSRKYLFGSASVYGENNNSVIQGAFVIRGDKFEPVFDVAPDYESYEFTKLDPKNEADREFVDAQWSWDRPATVDGKEYAHASGKVFK
ncbi:elongation factor EF-1 gamma subunit [Ceratocystis pirilliformis]|uniref:Elongation factor EF-1 gamma subunit n=1 Tax=Ceratocystis pirilliformis TaxID=259994 RepID=A0ABR3ZDR8_9PEZI